MPEVKKIRPRNTLVPFRKSVLKCIAFGFGSGPVSWVELKI